ncbi:MAG: DUF4352 domain-containing protein [Lachnospiraceae bacterium]|nr:DUF4352 domain-containing protein [Lachnospiraceae bacterium]
MKKKLFVTGIIICALACGCGSSDKKAEANKKVNETTTEATTEEPTTEEPAIIYNIGDTAELENWEINIAEMQIVDSVEDSIMIYKANEEGDKLVKVSATATNKGDEASTFCPSYGYSDDLIAKVINGEDEYSALILLGYGDGMHNKKVEAQASISGNMVFEIPESVASAEDELIVKFTYKGKELNFKVR